MESDGGQVQNESAEDSAHGAMSAIELQTTALNAG